MEVRLATGIVVYSTQVASSCVTFGNGVAHSVPFRVVPELSAGVILGMPWLRTVNPRIDWVLGTVWFGDDVPVLWCTGG